MRSEAALAEGGRGARVPGAPPRARGARDGGVSSSSDDSEDDTAAAPGARWCRSAMCLCVCVCVCVCVRAFVLVYMCCLFVCGPVRVCLCDCVCGRARVLARV